MITSGTKILSLHGEAGRNFEGHTCYTGPHAYGVVSNVIEAKPGPYIYSIDFEDGTTADFSQADLDDGLRFVIFD
jgi:hypothetical protein